jgi:short-subunit dehydrogenase
MPLVTLSERVVVITGASTGIGAETARRASAEGALVVLTSRRRAELEAIASQCTSPTLVVVADVTKRADVERVAAEALQRFGHFDVWINNVGRGVTRLPSELTDEDIDSMVEVNVKTALYGTQVALTHFRTRGTDQTQVINISSTLGRVPNVVYRAAYSASKHFLNALTANFRDEMAATHPNILITTVSPGLVFTEFGVNALHGGVDSRALRGVAPGQEVESVAATILHAMRTGAHDVYTARGARRRMLDYLGALAQDPPANLSF